MMGTSSQIADTLGTHCHSEVLVLAVSITCLVTFRTDEMRPHLHHCCTVVQIEGDVDRILACRVKDL